MTPTKNRRRRLSAFWPPLIQNRLLLLVYLIAYPVLTILYTVRGIQTEQQYHMPWTIADQLCATTLSFFLFLMAVLPFLYLINHMVKHTFSVPVVIRQRSKVRLWFHQLLQTAAAALAMTLYLLLCVVGAGKLLGLSTLNWSSPVSVYYTFTQTVNTEVTISRIVLFFIIACFLGLLTAGTLFLLLRWLTDQYLPGWIVLLALGAADSAGFSLLFDRLVLNHRRWVDPAEIPRNLLIPLVWLLAAAILGMFIARRKDFLRVQQKQNNE
ncbi:MAG: hypothetical protein HFJ79_00120 [Clostridiales bacterium]|nr:hypothetical protein [Clostridiales bacterium]